MQQTEPSLVNPRCIFEVGQRILTRHIKMNNFPLERFVI